MPAAACKNKSFRDNTGSCMQKQSLRYITGSCMQKLKLQEFYRHLRA